MKKYINLFDFSQKVNYKTEVLSGLTVALALVPEAVVHNFKDVTSTARARHRPGGQILEIR